MSKSKTRKATTNVQPAQAAPLSLPAALAEFATATTNLVRFPSRPVPQTLLDRLDAARDAVLAAAETVDRVSVVIDADLQSAGASAELQRIVERGPERAPLLPSSDQKPTKDDLLS